MIGNVFQAEQSGVQGHGMLVGELATFVENTIAEIDEFVVGLFDGSYLCEACIRCGLQMMQTFFCHIHIHEENLSQHTIKFLLHSISHIADDTILLSLLDDFKAKIGVQFSLDIMNVYPFFADNFDFGKTTVIEGAEVPLEKLVFLFESELCPFKRRHIGGVNNQPAFLLFHIQFLTFFNMVMFDPLTGKAHHEGAGANARDLSLHGRGNVLQVFKDF